MACRHAVASASAMVRMPPINLNLSLAVAADELTVSDTRVSAAITPFVAYGFEVGEFVVCDTVVSYYLCSRRRAYQFVSLSSPLPTAAPLASLASLELDCALLELNDVGGAT